MFRELNTMKIFFDSPTKEFNVREAARILKIAPATASKELKNLVKLGLLKGRKERILNLYKANIENGLYRDLKVFYNIRKIKDSMLLDSLNRYYLKPAIVLFGSASCGIDTETSDFDILVVSERKKDFPEKEKFEKKLKRKLQLFAVREIKDLNNEHLINNVLNGIVLQGEVKWI
ncbi:MAG: nucleotidyltransferase domain-containing protein [Candidatus Methanoperedens sp.]|nr:nucleotidyltransferase domain-containing protein [Candidatus Methanoperedens sp.]